MLMLRQFGKEDFRGTIRWVKYFPCHSQAHATCLLSHLITQLSPWLWFKNISMRPAPLIWLAKGTIFFCFVFRFHCDRVAPPLCCFERRCSLVLRIKGKT